MRPKNVPELLLRRDAVNIAADVLHAAELTVQDCIDRDAATPESETRTDLQRFEDLKSKVEPLIDVPSAEEGTWGDGVTLPKIVEVGLEGETKEYIVFFQLDSQRGNFSSITARWIRPGGLHGQDITERISNQYYPGVGSDEPSYRLIGNNIGNLETSFEAYMASDRMLDESRVS